MEQFDEVVEVKRKPKVENPVSSRPRMNENQDRNKAAVLEQIEDADRITNIRPSSSLPRNSKFKERITSESESSDTATDENAAKVAIDGFDYRVWENLELPKDVKELYQFIARYSPPKIELKYTLQPFIPDYIPAIGDVDALLKVVPPEPESKDNKLHEFIGTLGLEVLDEPCGEQSDPALLHMKLRATSTTNSRAPVPPPSIATSSKDTEKWIAEVQTLHANQPYPISAHNRMSPDIDQLMTEWPTKMEHVLNSIGFPSAQLNCSLKFYIELMCGLLDIPLPSTNNQIDYLLALTTLFNLYLAIKNPMD